MLEKGLRHSHHLTCAALGRVGRYDEDQGAEEREKDEKEHA